MIIPKINDTDIECLCTDCFNNEDRRCQLKSISLDYTEDHFNHKWLATCEQYKEKEKE